MPNWESEVHSYNRQQEEIRQRQNLEELARKNETERKQIETRAAEIDKISTDYESTTVPGFQILDRFDVVGNLSGIRDQIWKIGEIIKIPSLSDELCTYGIQPKNQSEQNIVSRIRSFFKNITDFNAKDLDKKIGHFSAKYILYTKTIEYVEPYEYSTPDDHGHAGDFVSNSDHVLIVATDCKNIYVLSENTEDAQISLNQDEEKIKDELHQALLKDCSKRHDFSKINPTVFSMSLFDYLRDGLEEKLPEELKRILLPYKQSQPNWDKFKRLMTRLNRKNGITNN